MINYFTEHWILAIVAFLFLFAIMLYLMIYFTAVGQDKVLRNLDLILLRLRRKNFKVLLETIPTTSIFDTALDEVRTLEKALMVDEYDFTKEIEKYNKLKKEIDERGYI